MPNEQGHKALSITPETLLLSRNSSHYHKERLGARRQTRYPSPQKEKFAPARVYRRDLLNNSFIVRDETPLSFDGRVKTTKCRPKSPAISQSPSRKPIVVNITPPRKNPTPFMAFFEPVNQATQRKRPSPSSILTTLMADFEAVLVMSLARPATLPPQPRSNVGDTKET